MRFQFMRCFINIVENNPKVHIFFVSEAQSEPLFMHNFKIKLYKLKFMVYNNHIKKLREDITYET